MPSTPTPGPDLDAAATHGGAGWLARTATHAEEIAAGELWSPYSVRSEVAPLQAVLLSWPGEELALDGDPDEQLMLEPVDVPAIQAQAEGLQAAYESAGVRVHLFRPDTPPPPNLIFMRDLFFMTPEGAILARPAALQRAGEERFAARALTAAGVPILRTLRGRATFEGADALWLDAQTVLVGVGLRTNDEAFVELKEVLTAQGVTARAIAMPGGVQHLLGLVNFLDDDLAALHGGKAPSRLKVFLASHGIETLTVPPGDELDRGRGMNFVTLAPRKVLMPAGCPAIRDQLEGAGVEVTEVEIGEYLKAAGGVGCLTGILSRG